MQNNQQKKSKRRHQPWWQCNGNQMAKQQAQEWQHLVQHDSVITSGK